MPSNPEQTDDRPASLEPPSDHPDDEHDLGLVHDLATMARQQRPPQVPLLERGLPRRRALTMIGGGLAATALLAACKTEVTGGGYDPTPEETAGPYPGDGSNGPNVLTASGVVRSDIRSSVGTASGTAAGIPMTVRIMITDVSDENEPKPGAALYLWHCDRDGKYSMYDLPTQNYLRGVQPADADGWVTFRTIFPGCYAGRWPHMHFEVYPSVASATSSANKVATSQLALPEWACVEAYATSGYATSRTNLTRTTLATDNVFRDGWTHQLAEVTGNVTDGYTATLIIAVP